MKKFSIEIKWGIIYTLALVVLAIIEKETGLYGPRIKDYPMYSLLYTVLFAPVGLIIYIVAIAEKKRKYYHGTVDWRQAFYSGLILTAVIALLVPVQQNLIHRVIAPEFFDNAIAYATTVGKKTPAEAQQLFNLSETISNGIQLALSAGVVASAGLALVLKSKTK